MAGNEAAHEIAAVGAAVKRERARQGLTVQALSERSGVSFGLISQLENGKGNPSFVSLYRIAGALELPLTSIIGRPSDDAMVVRRDQRKLLPVAPSEPEPQRVRRELLTPATTSTLQVIRSTLPPGFSNEGRPFRHLGTESVTVEIGKLVVVHGDRRIELDTGDSITYGCSVPHWWANETDDATVVMGSVTPFEP